MAVPPPSKGQPPPFWEASLASSPTFNLGHQRKQKNLFAENRGPAAETGHSEQFSGPGRSAGRRRPRCTRSTRWRPSSSTPPSSHCCWRVSPGRRRRTASAEDPLWPCGLVWREIVTGAPDESGLAKNIDQSFTLQCMFF